MKARLAIPLSAAVLGTGAGTISGTGGFSCPGPCRLSYMSGTTVTLTATPAAGSTFAGWSGACTGLNTTCVVTMTASETVTAVFAAQPIGQTYTETVGGNTNTWSDYTSGGGNQGPTIPMFTSVQVTCRVQGLAVDQTPTAPAGDVWWYEISSPGWNNQYFASADAFYNNGQVSGSLLGTPLYDPSVPLC